MTSRHPKLLMVASHPVQYAVPQHRRQFADPRLDITVAFCSLQGAERGFDAEFGLDVQWDVPLLEGYRWLHPPNRSPLPRLRGFFGMLNPGLWRIVRSGGYDVVICFGYRAASFWIAALAARAARSKLVWTTDGTTLGPREGGDFKLRLKRLVVPSIFKVGDAVLVPSSRGKRFVESLGIARDRVLLTPYVVDNVFFSSRAAVSDPKQTRANWGIEEDAFIALFVGKLVPWKRPGDVLEAVARVRGAYAVFVGDGSLRIQLEKRAYALGIANRVRFIGFANQTELPAIYRSADVLILPSEFEPFGLVVNEAMACGTPALVSRACAAADDLVREGESGYTFRAGDVPALARHLQNMVSHPDLRPSLHSGAKRSVAAWTASERDSLLLACSAIMQRTQS